MVDNKPKNLLFLIENCIPEDSSRKLKKISFLKSLKKNEYLIKKNEKADSIFFLKKGIITCSDVNENGKKFTKHLFLKEETVSSLTCLSKKNPSKFNYKCLTDCSLIGIHYKGLKELFHEDFYLSNLYLKLVENSFSIIENRVLELQELNSTQRYLKLLEKCHDIDNLIPQHEIASYLNITPVQFSRIKKEALKQYYKEIARG